LSRIVLGMFTDTLPSKRRPIDPRVAFSGNVFNLSLSTNEFMSHSIVTDLLKAFLGHVLVNRFQRASMEDVSQWTNVIARC
jgi:hypothetical protein